MPYLHGMQKRTLGGEESGGSVVSGDAPGCRVITRTAAWSSCERSDDREGSAQPRASRRDGYAPAVASNHSEARIRRRFHVSLRA